jgi:hypothetical protein
MALLVVHLWGKFWMAAWRGRRTLTWITGVAAFATSVVECFTGYLSQQNFDSQWISTSGKDAFNSDGLLTIQGGRRAARDAARERVHRSARCYGAFRRPITLPGHLQAGKIEATAQDGMLRDLVPKAPDVQARHIPVRVGQPAAAVTAGASRP